MASPLARLAAAGIIETVVGGANGDGYSAPIAKTIPQHLVFDSAGNLLLADQRDHRIRRIDGQSNIASTIAGSGVFGFFGEGVPALEAKLGSPVGVAIDPNGNVYFSDQLNQRIRRIHGSTGIINTVVGTGLTIFNGDGLGVTRNISYPAGLSWTPSGLLFAESASHRIRRLDANGNVTTVAGSGSMGFGGDGGSALSAKLSNPTHAIQDARGNIYIADRANCRVRKIDPSGTITTFAGLPEGSSLPCGRTGDNGPANAAKLNGPSALALDPQQQNLYIVDSLAVVIRRVNLDSGYIYHVAGTGFPGDSGDGGPAAQAALGSPTGITFNSAGHLFVADANLRRVRRVNSDGIIETVVGGSTADGLPAAVMNVAPKDLAMDPWGNLHITDAINNRSRKVDPDQRAGTVAGTGDFGFGGDGGPATRAELAFPLGVAVDDNGRMCFADQLNHRVRCVHPSTNVITTLAGTGQAMFNGDGSATAASLNYPAGLLFDGDSLLIADSTNHRIRRVKDGTISTVAGSGSFWFNGDGLAPLATNLNSPTSVVKDAAGNLYIAEKSSCRVRKLDAASNTMVTIGGTGSCGSTGDGGPATSAKINGPENLALHPNGILYVSESFTPRVRQIDLATGIISRVAGTGVVGYSGDGGNATLAQMMRVGGMMVDGTGAFLYIADYDAGNVRRVTLDGGGGGSQPSATPTNTLFVPTFTATPTPLPATATPVPPSPTPAWTATATASPTSSFTRTPTITPTFTRTGTFTRTPILTATPTNTPPSTATPTDAPNTATPTFSRIPSATLTPVDTATVGPTATFSATVEPSATRTDTEVPTATPTRTATSTLQPTLTRTPTRASTATRTRTSSATRTVTRTRTPTRPSTATATRTMTRTRTATKASTATRTRTPTQALTATRTRTATAQSAVFSPTVATRTPTLASTATRTRTATLTRTPTRTRTATRTTTFTRTPTGGANTATPTAPAATFTATPEGQAVASSTATKPAGTSTRTATVTRTATRTRTFTPTRTFTRTRTATRTSTATRTATQPTATRTPIQPTDTPTPEVTATPTEDPLQSASNAGPIVTHMGLASSSGVPLAPVAQVNGVDVYAPGSGFNFYFVLEAKKGNGNGIIGRRLVRLDTGPDLQIEVNQALGNGNPSVCESAGGVPAIWPLDFMVSASVVAAWNDLSCNFYSTVSPSLGVTYEGTAKAFVDGESEVQFSYLVPSARLFASGDTLVTGRVLDIDGRPGPIEQIIVRVD